MGDRERRIEEEQRERDEVERGWGKMPAQDQPLAPAAYVGLRRREMAAPLVNLRDDTTSQDVIAVDAFIRAGSDKRMVDGEVETLVGDADVGLRRGMAEIEAAKARDSDVRLEVALAARLPVEDRVSLEEQASTPSDPEMLKDPTAAEWAALRSTDPVVTNGTEIAAPSWALDSLWLYDGQMVCVTDPSPRLDGHIWVKMIRVEMAYRQGQAAGYAWDEAQTGAVTAAQLERIREPADVLLARAYRARQTEIEMRDQSASSAKEKDALLRAHYALVEAASMLAPLGISIEVEIQYGE